MKRAVLAVTLLGVAVIAGCGKPEEPAHPAPPAASAPEPAKAIGESCSQDCGGGQVAAIQCAEGETPVCDCAKIPNASCVMTPQQPPKP